MRDPAFIARERGLARNAKTTDANSARYLAYYLDTIAPNHVPEHSYYWAERARMIAETLETASAEQNERLAQAGERAVALEKELEAEKHARMLTEMELGEAEGKRDRYKELLQRSIDVSNQAIAKGLELVARAHTAREQYLKEHATTRQMARTIASLIEDLNAAEDANEEPAIVFVFQAKDGLSPAVFSELALAMGGAEIMGSDDSDLDPFVVGDWEDECEPQ